VETQRGQTEDKVDKVPYTIAPKVHQKAVIYGSKRTRARGTPKGNAHLHGPLACSFAQTGRPIGSPSTSRADARSSS